MPNRPYKIDIKKTPSQVRVRVTGLKQKVGKQTNDTASWELDGGSVNDTVEITAKNLATWPFQNHPLSGPGNAPVASGPLKAGVALGTYPYTIEVKRAGERYVIDPDMIVDTSGGGGGEPGEEGGARAAAADTEIPGPACIKTVELHGQICIPSDDWERVKEVLEDHVSDECSGCYLKLFVNEHGNLALGCYGEECGPGEDCCLELTYMDDRGHRASCVCQKPDAAE